MMVWGQEKAYWLWRPQTPAMKNTACGFISAAAWWAVRVPWIGSHSSDTVAKPGTDYNLFKGWRDAVHSASNTWHNMMAEEQAQGQPAVQSHCGLGTVGWARTALACVRVIGVGQTQRGWERVLCPPGAEAPCSSVRHCPDLWRSSWKAAVLCAAHLQYSRGSRKEAWGQAWPRQAVSGLPKLVMCRIRDVKRVRFISLLIKFRKWVMNSYCTFSFNVGASASNLQSFIHRFWLCIDIWEVLNSTIKWNVTSRDT